MQPPFEIQCLQGDSIAWADHLEKTDSGLYLPACTGFECYGGWGQMDFRFVQKRLFSIWCSRYKAVKRRDFMARSKEALLEFSLQMDHPLCTGLLLLITRL